MNIIEIDKFCDILGSWWNETFDCADTENHFAIHYHPMDNHIGEEACGPGNGLGNMMAIRGISNHFKG